MSSPRTLRSWARLCEHVRVFAISTALAGGACSKSPSAEPTSAGSAQSGSGSGSGSGSAAQPDLALGVLHFNVSGGSSAARAQFAQGLLALHSFWYDEAITQFQAAIATDPTFAMAYWGLAMSHAKLLWGDDDLAAGRDALTRMPAPNTLPPHDQAWVMAALTLYKHASLDVHRSRQEFLAIMEQVNAKFPDEESALFLALAILSVVHPNDPDELAQRRRAGALAAGVFKTNPKHPGAAHYLLHAYDHPELAELALPAAEAYASIAPAAFHALHMPAHIFARLGRWKAAAASCQAAWDASVTWVHRDHLSLDHQDFHSLAWLIEINFERGRRGDGDRAMALYADAVKAGLTNDKRAAFANQVGSYLARTGEWNRVDELLEPLAAPAAEPKAAWTSTSTAQACGRTPEGNGAPTKLFEKRAVISTRALAAAMLHDTAKLTKLLAAKTAVDAELHPFLVATQAKEFVASVDALQPIVGAALTARAKGDVKGLLAALQPLATDQEQEFTGEGTAGGVLRAEEIAEILLELGQARQAVDAFTAVLARHAGRARSLLGAARAATKAGDLVAARAFYAKLLAVWVDAEPGTPGLDEARANVAP